MGERTESKLKLNQNSNVLVIEDLVSTGKSSLNAIEPLLEIGCNVTGILSVFTYNFPEALNKIKEKGINFKSLCTYEN